MQTKEILFTYSRHLHVLFSLECSIHIVSFCCCSSIYLLTTIFRCQTKLSFLARFAENKQQHLHTLLGFIFRFYVASSYRAIFFSLTTKRKSTSTRWTFRSSSSRSLWIQVTRSGYLWIRWAPQIVFSIFLLQPSSSVGVSREFSGQPIRSFSWCRVRRSAKKCSLLFCQWLWNSPH